MMRRKPDLDVAKATAVLRSEGLDVPGTDNARMASGYLANGDCVLAFGGRTIGVVDGNGREAASMEELAARLMKMAALCRRVDAESRVAQGEPVGRDEP